MNQRSSRMAVTGPGPHDTESFGQVLPFRRPGVPAPLRVSERLRPDPGLAFDSDEDLTDDFARFERERDGDPQELDETVNYRQRMLMNFIALAVVAFLVGTGVWLADTIADMERDQDCVMQGRANCAPIELPMPAQP
ncbi:MAG TPA: hypothetical protein VMC05_17195 [Xanthobacteraceae bacterium]|nr:hypothetical protein [Xanthobacteraceae bacterium]